MKSRRSLGIQNLRCRNRWHRFFVLEAGAAQRRRHFVPVRILRGKGDPSLHVEGPRMLVFRCISLEEMSLFNRVQGGLHQPCIDSLMLTRRRHRVTRNKDEPEPYNITEPREVRHMVRRESEHRLNKCYECTTEPLQ